MPTIKELRGRIRSLKNTSKITSAMKMVSAAKLRRSQEAYQRTVPYFEKLQETIDRLSSSLEEFSHPLMEERQGGLTRYYLISSDRGLCGGFNNNLFRYFMRRAALDEAEVVTLGRRARDFANRRRINRAPGTETSTNVPAFDNASRLAQALIDDFVSRRVNRALLVFNRFNSVISQTPQMAPLLPILQGGTTNEPRGRRLNYIFEPDARTLIDNLLPRLVVMNFLRVLLENAAGEHGARMTAMDSATKNTKDLIGSLTLSMNRARQAAITKELIEIVSGAESLKG